MKITPTVLGFSVILTCSFIAGRSSLPRASANGITGKVLESAALSHISCRAIDGVGAQQCGRSADAMPGTAGAARIINAVRKVPSYRSLSGLDEMQFPGARTVAAQSISTTTTLRVIGTVTPDEQRVHSVSAGLDGSVRETYDAGIGSRVKKGERLAAFYSAEFLPYANSYLVASDRIPAPLQEASAGVHFAAARLRNLGVGEGQIRELGSSRKVPENIDVVSPIDGVIVARSVARGQRISRGMELYRVANLSSVGIVAEVPGESAMSFRPGANVAVTSPETAKVLRADVVNLLPQGDPRSKSIQIRLEAPNSDLLLRPNMSVIVELPIKSSASTSLPEDAVLDSGLHQTVFVDRGNGFFAVREVKTGKHFGSRIEITGGLQAGERVAASASFLIDSETSLHGSGSAAGDPRRSDGFGDQR